MLRHLDGEVEHGALAGRDVGHAVVGADLVGEHGILAEDAERRAVGHGAIGAGIDTAHREHDHLALGARELRRPLHQHVVVVEEGAEVLRLVAVGQEDVGREARLGGVGVEDLPDVLRKGFGVRNGKAADRRSGVGHHGTLLEGGQ